MPVAQTKTDLVVIGGGAAGLMAACAAAEAGRRVVVCERMPSPGLKLLATGGGRCNLTHTATADEIMAAFGRRGRFMQTALRDFDPTAIRQFFAADSVPTVEEADGCVFPASHKSRDILNVFQEMAKKRGVEIRGNCTVRRIIVRDGAVAGVDTNAGEIATTHVVLATGGRSYPALGSDGSGFELAAATGHTIVTPVPALVGLVTEETWLHALTGIVLPQARVRVALKGHDKIGKTGPLLFTHRGISGPPVLDLSGEVAALLAAGGASVPVAVSWRADRDGVAWRKLIEGWRTQFGARSLHNLLSGELPRGVAQALCNEVGLREITAAQAKREQIDLLVKQCAEMTLHISATEDWNRAMVTRGGVALNEVDPHTLTSRLVRGLFFAGEVLDLDGPCGGYNLTWAFASGRLAGRAAI
jgi:hypothetical protein